MSKLQDLINELCPDGVEYIMLGELTNYGKERIVTTARLSQRSLKKSRPAVLRKVSGAKAQNLICA